MPIEAVFHPPEDTTTIGSKLLSREEFWYKELGSIYPYGLNDNVKQLGNVSQKIECGLVMYSLFNKHKRKFRKRSKPRNKVKVGGCWKHDFVNLLNNYKCPNFCHKPRTILHTLSKRLLKITWDVTEEYLLEDKIPSRVGILIRDFISFKNKLHLDNIEDKLEEVRNKGGWFLKLMFHNKGIDMIDLPGILH